MEQEQKTKNDNLRDPKTPMEYLRLLFTGFAMGSADIVPGVSGGTMAFILGIYETLINAIKSFDVKAIRLGLGLKFKELFEYVPIRFLIALGIGLLLAIVLLSGLLSTLLDDPTGRILVFAFFFGLVLASILAIGMKVRWSLRSLATLVSGTIIALIIINVVPAEAPHEPLNLFVSGMIAICAMILPGVSGAFILLILGQYDYVLSAVSQRDLPPVIFVGLGAVVGIILFSRILSWFLTHYYHATVATLVGFMVGSLWKIWPWKECIASDLDRHGDFRCLQEANILPDSSGEIIVAAVALMIIGFIIVSFMDHLQEKNNPIIRLFWR